MGDVRDAVARLTALVDELVGSRLSDLDGSTASEVHGHVRAARDRLGVLSARLLAVVEAEGTWAGGAAATLPQQVARQQGVSVGAARREVVLGRELESLPATRAAVTAGEITLEHAQVLADAAASSAIRRDALTGADGKVPAETELLAAARRAGVDQFRRTVRSWAAGVDTAATEREHAESVAREHLTVARRRDGLSLTGFLTHEHGAALVTALRAVGGVPAADDPRSREQRQAAALAGMARVVLDRGLAGAGQQVRPHISVHVPYETYRAVLEQTAARSVGARASDGPRDTARDERSAVGQGSGADDHPGGATRQVPDRARPVLVPAELDSGEPLPPSVLARLACDAEVTRVVLGPDRAVLDVGRVKRTYSGQQRRAVVARDRHCQYPRCTAPPVLSEVHHAVWWCHGGETSVDNGVLLCWFHHDLVHRRRIAIARVGDGWEFRYSDGTLLAELAADQARSSVA